MRLRASFLSELFLTINSTFLRPRRSPTSSTPAPDKLRERAQEIGETIAKNSPTAMAATKKALWGALEAGLTDACKEGAKHLVSMWGHPDQTEGPMAFAEKREPDWAELSE